jgi:hypothetical protein
MNVSARYSIGQSTNISFNGEDCLLFDSHTERLIAGAHIDFEIRI